MDRRSFLAAMTALAGSIPSTTALAADGGKPVRARPLRASYYGPECYDDKELFQLSDVLEKRLPFRWYGAGSQPPMKVLTFEKELAARMQTRYALAVTSGTAALTTALAALGVGPGDEVILPALELVLLLQLHRDARRPAGVRRVGRVIEHRPRRPRVEDHAANESDHGRPCARQPGRHGHHHGPRPQARGSRCSRTAQSVGGSYKGKPLGSIGDIGIYSFQIAKTISSGEGGGVVTSDPLLFERASRYHDLGLLRPPHEQMLGEAALTGMIGSQYRMSEFTGGVLLAQLRKLDTIIGALRGHARRVYEGLAGLPDLHLRHRPDPEGDIGTGIWLGFPSPAQRDKFLAAMRAENVPATPPQAVALVPLHPSVEQKLTAHPHWPSFVERARPVNSLWCGVLPQDDRYPAPIRRRRARSRNTSHATSTTSWRPSARSIPRSLGHDE